MNIPLNGRIAIIDDNYEQALPLMQALAKKRCPYLYYSGDLSSLPEEEEVSNDIRILFLDINLIDDTKRTEKELRAKLVPVLTRVISEDNYPYVLIYWSRNEEEHRDLVQDIFENILPTRKPIIFLSQNKLNYFNLDGEKADNHDSSVKELFENIAKLVEQNPAYSYLIDWENYVHNSADNTLQEVFSSCHSYPDWTDNANFIINKLGESYAGKSTFKKQSPADKIKSSYKSFNNVFFDTLEYSTNSLGNKNIVELTYTSDMVNTNSIYSLNKKLLCSDDNNQNNYPGTSIEVSDGENDNVFKDLLNSSHNRRKVSDRIRKDSANVGKTEPELKKIIDDECKVERDKIKESWKKIYLVATPLCDFVQNKCFNTRVVKGMIIKADYKEYINDQSEAIFISPKFKYNNDVYIIILNFKYFFTISEFSGKTTPLFRLRQQLLAEVQSKLARHINRQGVLFIDES
jgi:hypothetical protein